MRDDSKRERRREREAALRRADVLAAASAVFARKGFHDAQMSEIAAESELSLRSVYTLFESKEEIYQEVVVSTAARMREAVRGKVEAIEDPAERLLALIDLLFDTFEENRDLFGIYARGTRGLPWRLRESMGDSAHAIFHGFTVWLTELCQAAGRAGHLAGADPEAFALALTGAVTTTATHWLDVKPGEPLTGAAAGVRSVFAPLLERTS